MKRIFPILFQVVVLTLVGYVTWVAVDREPPQWRLSGTISVPGRPGEMPVAGTIFIVTWKTTPHIRDCPGIVESEVFDSEHNTWPRPLRGPYEPAPGAISFTPDPWFLPGLAAPGPAVYRVTTFWYCTWFEWWFARPVVQVGPDIEFTIMPVAEQKT